MYLRRSQRRQIGGGSSRISLRRRLWRAFSNAAQSRKRLQDFSNEMCSGSGRGESSEHKTNGQLRSRHDGNASAFHAPGPNNKKDPARGAGQGSPPTQRLFFNDSPRRAAQRTGAGSFFGTLFRV